MCPSRAQMTQSDGVDRAAALLAAAIRAAVLARAPRRTVSAVGAAVAGALAHPAMPAAETRRLSEAGAPASSRLPTEQPDKGPSAEELLAALRSRRREARHAKKARRRASRVAPSAAPPGRAREDGDGDRPEDGPRAGHDVDRQPPPQVRVEPQRTDPGAGQDAAAPEGQAPFAASGPAGGHSAEGATSLAAASPASADGADLVVREPSGSMALAPATPPRSKPIRCSEPASGSGRRPKKTARLRNYQISTPTPQLGGHGAAPSGEIPALPSSGGAWPHLQGDIPVHEPELTDLMYGFTETEQDEIQALCAQMEQEEQAHEAYPPLSIGPHAGATGK